MTIYRLAQHLEFADQTAALMSQTWPQYYGQHGPGDAATDVRNRIAEDRAAVTVLENRVVGTVAMDAQSFGSQGESPWLVGLCTAPDVRGQGIATAMASWVMGSARKAGHPALFTTTRPADGIMKRLGWRRIRQVADESGAWTVWRVALSGT